MLLGLAALAVFALVAGAVLLGRSIFGRESFAISEALPQTAALDAYPYRVQGGHPSAEEAAELMARLNARITHLLRSLRAKYLRGPRPPPARAKATQRLLALYNPDNLAENSPHDPEGDTSYTVDKGALLALCLREKEAGAPLHDPNLLMFVALHELTHISLKVQDHPPEFWAAFRWLLEEAVAAGVYWPHDFGRHPRSFCGTRVDYQPLFDRGLPFYG